MTAAALRRHAPPSASPASGSSVSPDASQTPSRPEPSPLQELAEKYDVCPGDVLSALVGTVGLPGSAYRAAASLTLEQRARLTRRGSTWFPPDRRPSQRLPQKDIATGASGVLQALLGERATPFRRPG